MHLAVAGLLGCLVFIIVFGMTYSIRRCVDKKGPDDPDRWKFDKLDWTLLIITIVIALIVGALAVGKNKLSHNSNLSSDLNGSSILTSNILMSINPVLDSTSVNPYSQSLMGSSSRSSSSPYSSRTAPVSITNPSSNLLYSFSSTPMITPISSSLGLDF